MKLYIILDEQGQTLMLFACVEMKIVRAGPQGDGLHRMTLTDEENRSIELRISEKFTVKEYSQ